MISIREQSYGLNVAIYNEFTLEDFQELERALLAEKGKIHLPDILLDMSMLKDFTIDMAVEQVKFLNEHDNDFGRVAVVTDDIWIKLGARLSSLLTNQHPKYFEDTAKAQAWLLEHNSK
ncbi:SpoIIAA family protein [Neisseria chenwenguii]|uniref:STAS/SEC14 domain-containing protein n=1 Tax=Neisseria chenwenguii TaxID=1853278 RepID=A0A220RZ18_9NEIS|nr:STAS/SEC14 domain-containing protein [Neisseria chenwenguii]ASK26449.1 STAS/SEC14 domain-containing protein [Neisseria chenwenguii]ROV53863.1 STAS/SEC14 domain-containing protein [Neisseria chenwenguii]